MVIAKRKRIKAKIVLGSFNFGSESLVAELIRKIDSKAKMADKTKNVTTAQQLIICKGGSEHKLSAIKKLCTLDQPDRFNNKHVR